MINKFIEIINTFAPVRFADIHAKMPGTLYEDAKPVLDDLVQSGKICSLEYELPTGTIGRIYFPARTHVKFNSKEATST